MLQTEKRERFETRSPLEQPHLPWALAPVPSATGTASILGDVTIHSVSLNHVSRSGALVSNSFLLLLVKHLPLVAMHLLLNSTMWEMFLGLSIWCQTSLPQLACERACA